MMKPISLINIYLI